MFKYILLMNINEYFGMSDVLTCGCSAHILNLPADDMDIPKIAEHTKQVIEYIPCSKYVQISRRKSTCSTAGFMMEFAL